MGFWGLHLWTFSCVLIIFLVGNLCTVWGNICRISYLQNPLFVPLVRLCSWWCCLVLSFKSIRELSTSCPAVLLGSHQQSFEKPFFGEIVGFLILLFDPWFQHRMSLLCLVLLHWHIKSSNSSSTMLLNHTIWGECKTRHYVLRHSCIRNFAKKRITWTTLRKCVWEVASSLSFSSPAFPLFPDVATLLRDRVEYNLL